MTETTSDTLTIQPFEPAHTRAVIDLIVHIQQKEFEIPITAADQPDLSTINTFYQTGCGNFWVALDRGRVVGSVALLDIGGQYAALRKMFVKKSHRGRERGTAEKLLGRLVDWARSKDLAAIFLGTTPKFLAAHRFYEKNGFREIEKTGLPGTFPVMKVDTRFYRLDL